MRLTEATGEEKVARDRLTHAPWGSPLELQAWLRRELQLRAHPWSRAAMRTWFLRGDGGEVLSSCETFAMPSTAGSAAGTTHGVASVFTEERFRGRGHAAELLRQVHRRVAEEDRLAQAFILFSEVGAGVYERAGYTARREWDEDFAFTPSADTGPLSAEVVAEEELGRLVACAPPPPRVGLRVHPSAEQLDWHRERERFYAQVLGRPRAPGCGARHPDGVCAWAGNLRSNRLYVLFLRAQTAAAAAALIEAARRAAHAAGLGAVHLWKCALPEGFSAPAVPRDQALPMIHPLRPDVRAEDWTDIPRALWI